MERNKEEEVSGGGRACCSNFTRKVDVRLPGKGKLPLREAGPPNHHDDKGEADQ